MGKKVHLFGKENRGINYLRNYCGLSSTTTLNTFNASICATFLRGRHSIVLMKGAKGSFLGIQTTSGHAWVIDGYLEAFIDNEEVEEAVGVVGKK